MPKLEKSTDHNYKLISSEDGQDTSACKISGQSLHAFSGKCPETSTDGRTCCKTVTVGRVDQATHVPRVILHRINPSKAYSDEGFRERFRLRKHCSGCGDPAKPLAPTGPLVQPVVQLCICFCGRSITIISVWLGISLRHFGRLCPGSSEGYPSR